MTYHYIAGHNDDLGTTMEPISTGGIWPTPQVAGATKLRVKAGGDAGDDVAGVGAQVLELIGMDAEGNFIREKLPTNGALASQLSVHTYMRLFDVQVHGSGTYASPAVGSHVAAITIENAAGTEDWAEIELHGGAFPPGRTEICAFTTPLGYKGRVLSWNIENSASKAVDAVLFARPNILQTAAPFSGMRALETFAGIPVGGSVGFESEGHGKILELPPLCDLGFMAEVATAGGEVAARMVVQLVPENA